MATFRDLITEADQQLVDATKRLGVLSQPEAAHVARELATLNRICGRILDDVLDGCTDPRADTARWRSAAGDARERVRSAERQLARAATKYAPDATRPSRRAPGPATQLRTAVRRLGLAEEFLQSDLAAGPSGAPMPKLSGASGLADPATARELTALTGRWIGLVGEITRGLANQIQIPRRSFRIDVEPMPRLFRQAAGCARHSHATIAAAAGQRTGASERLDALPRSRVQVGHEAQSGPVGELIQEAAEKASAVRSALQPRAPRPWEQPSPPPSARSLRYTATSAGSSHVNAAILTRQLAARAAELHGAADGPQHRALVRAAEALADTGRAWHAAARQWDAVTTRDTRLTDAAAHATGTVMRLGQATFADPDWTPTSRRSPVRAAAEIAATDNELRCAADHLHSLVTAYAGAARASRHAIEQLRETDALRTDRGGEQRAASRRQVNELGNAYAAVLERSVTAERWLRAAVAPTRRDPADAPALVAAEFPVAPLTRPAGATTTQPPAPDASAARPLRRAQ